jgi:putative peptide zinc metalloprotease protein
MLGEYQGSACTEAPYLLRRPDGRMLSISRLLYLVVAEIDGQRDVGEIAARMTMQLGRRVNPDHIQFLINEKLAPTGVVVDRHRSDGGWPTDPVLGIGLRGAILPDRFVQAAGTALSRLFLPAIIITVVAGLLAFDAWLFVVHGIARPLRQTLSDPAAMVLVYAVVVSSATFHELGHAAGGRYGGARAGRIGVGLYLIWPAFFSDMTDSYRLSRGGRIRTDMGGVYFNTVFILGCAAAYAFTGFEPILAAIVMQHILMAYQFLPFLRLDGYYLVSDLIGVPDLFSRIRPVLRSLVPGRATGPALPELRRWARVLVTMWVVVTIPLLIGAAALFVVRSPQFLRTVTEAILLEAHTVGVAVRRGDPILGVLASVQLVVLAVVPAGLVLTSHALFRRARSSLRTSTRARSEPQTRAQPDGTASDHTLLYRGSPTNRRSDGVVILAVVLFLALERRLERHKHDPRRRRLRMTR